jgi:hypothetical protein
LEETVVQLILAGLFFLFALLFVLRHFTQGLGRKAAFVCNAIVFFCYVLYLLPHYITTPTLWESQYLGTDLAAGLFLLSLLLQATTRLSVTEDPSEDTAPEEVTTETPVETTGEATEEATTEAPTESDGEESTAGESVTETDTPSAETDTQDRESPSDVGGIDMILLVIFGALEVVLMVVLTVLVKKRKGSAA